MNPEIESLEGEWATAKVQDLPPHNQQAPLSPEELTRLSARSQRAYHRRREDTKLVWKHLMMCGGYKCIWEDFERFCQDMGMTPSPRHVLSKRDFTKAHGPLNSYWKPRK